MRVSDTTRSRLEMQGYTGLNDQVLAEAAPWLRLAPAVCGIWTLIATYYGSYQWIWALAPFALWGAVFSHHPFDALYNFIIRHFLGRNTLPPNGPARRFACTMGTLILVSTGYCFYNGFMMTGYFLGYQMFAVATLVASTDFCIPSWVFDKVLKKHIVADAKA